MSSFLDAFDVDKQKLELLDKAIAQDPRQNDKRICICGHSMSRHKINDYSGKMECRPARFKCPCNRKHPVIEVPNTKYFLSRTAGSGEKHALTRGIYLSQKALGEEFDNNAKWLVDMCCENPACKAETKLYPVMCDPDGFRLYESRPDNENPDQGYTWFLCETCRDVYHDSEEATAVKRAALKTRNTATPN